MNSLILNNVSYSYSRKSPKVLSDVSAEFYQGTISSICGHSGAGKSTLLYLIAGLDTPTEGELLFNEKRIEKKELTQYRRNTASLIAQNYLLFPYRTALENVCYPLLLSGVKKSEAIKEAKEHLAAVHIEEMLYNRLPSKLSGGEQQRVAIARCLACHSPIIAADEPTGNLDEENAKEVMSILENLAEREQKIIIVVTHDQMIAESAHIQYVINNGKLDLQGV